MNSICLSAAPNLRCQGLSRIENIAILIPPAIEFIFCITLALSPTTGRKHWLLVADGVVFLLLALLDSLSHILFRSSSNPIVFKIIDLVLAAASLLPVLLYMLFLYLFARSNLISLLPSRFRLVTTFVLLAIIPFAVVGNELGSLLGIRHRQILKPSDAPVVVALSENLLERIGLFFSAGTLALLTVFQAIVFALSFIRVIRAFIDERRLEDSREKGDAPDEVHLFRGLGWFSLGLKLGAIESVVGFANSSFGVTIARRLIRLFGRGSIIIGVIKGMNMVENFVRLESDMKAIRSNSKRAVTKRLSPVFISNPRASTFREMSPQASSFHASQRLKKANRVGPSPLALGDNSTHKPFNPPPVVAVGRKERVTVMYNGKTPPVLQMRFSSIELPVPPAPAPPALLRRLPTVIEKAETYTGTPISSASSSSDRYRSETRKYTLARADSKSSNMLIAVPATARTVSGDTLDVMRDFTSKFPGLPQRDGNGGEPDARPQQQEGGGATPAASSTTDVSPANSVRLKPPPQPTSRHKLEVQTSFIDMDPSHDRASAMSTAARGISPATSEGPSVYSDTTRISLHDPSPGTSIEFSPSTPANLFVKPLPRNQKSAGGDGRGAAAAIEAGMPPQGGMDDEELDETQRERLRLLHRAAKVQDGHVRGGSHGGGDRSWKRSGPLFSLQDTLPERESSLAPSDFTDTDDVDEAVIEEAWRRAGLTRIRTVSRVYTAQTVEHDVRGSLFAVEEEDAEAGALSRGSSVRRPRLDSGVLSEEDRRLVRESVIE